MTASKVKQQTAAYVEAADVQIQRRLKMLPRLKLMHRDMGEAWMRRTILQLLDGKALAPNDAGALAALLAAHFIDGGATLDAIAPKGRPPEQRIGLDDVFNARATAGSTNKALALLAQQRGMTPAAAKQAYSRARREAIADAVKELRAGRGVRPLDDAAIEAMVARYSDIFSPEDHEKRRCHIIGWNEIAREAWAKLNTDSA